MLRNVDSPSARDRARMPAEAGHILSTRSLATSHRRLAELLRPGMRVLDMGCGTAAITADVADAVGPDGLVVGADSNAILLAQGRARFSRPALHFVDADLHAVPFHRAFDIVTAARVLQWVADPGAAVLSLSRVVKPPGTLLVLDYDHTQIRWTPSPPPSMQRFYAAFLQWRAAAGMDNAIATRLAGHFAAAGLVDVCEIPQHEHTQRGDADFSTRIGIWADVAATRGHQMVGDGVLTETERAAAEAEYRRWTESAATSMTLFLLAVEGVVE